MQKKNVKSDYIIFDLDGTLIDSSEGIVDSFNYSLRKNGFKQAEPKKIISVIGISLNTMFNQVSGSKDEKKIACLVQDYLAHYMDNGLSMTSLFPKTFETLKTLKDAGKIMWVATNKPDYLALTAIKGLGIEQFFDEVSCNKLEHEKAIYTKKEVINKLLKKHSPGKAVMIGDSYVDIKAAKELGLFAIAVTYGAGSKDQLLAEQPDLVIDDISELKYILV